MNNKTAKDIYLEEKCQKLETALEPQFYFSVSPPNQNWTKIYQYKKTMDIVKLKIEGRNIEKTL